MKQAAINSDLYENTEPREDIIISSPVLMAFRRKAYWMTVDGEILSPSKLELGALISSQTPIVCHAGFTASQLGISPFIAHDLLELFAFVYPAEFCLPNITGMAKKLLPCEDNLKTAEDQCMAALDIAQKLLYDLKSNHRQEYSDPVSIAFMMGLGKEGLKQQSGWPWASLILQVLGKPEGHEDIKTSKSGVQIWNRIQEWAEEAPLPPPGHEPVSKEEALKGLENLIEKKFDNAKPRVEQKSYTTAIIPAFQPRNDEDRANIVMAEAGTGTGKTFGYLAPAAIWAEKNKGSVWISTYTKNLQRQVDQELDSLYTNKDEKNRNVVIRKGRENYLCLLNLEEAVNSPVVQNNIKYATGVGLVARWAAASRDGDINSGDFPGWLIEILGWRSTLGLADRRGECMFSACRHYHKCFVEKSQRLSQRAKIVIANHALVMHRTASSHPHDNLPNRYVFDEGHHIFNAADSAFSISLTGKEAAELRRWILGIESQQGGSSNRGHNKGLKRRIEELVADNEDGKQALDDIIQAAYSLPGHSWMQRLQSEQPKGLVEGFLFLARQQVYARNNTGHESLYSLETDVLPAIDGLFESSYALSSRLRDLTRPIKKLIKILQQKLIDGVDTLSSDSKKRIESICHSLQIRSDNLIAGWIDMLACIQMQEKNPDFVDWLHIERIEGREYDIGMRRHWLDPSVPFAGNLKPHAHGVVVTSASLLDTKNADDGQWSQVTKQTGMLKLNADNMPVDKIQLSSPYNYSEQSKIIVVTDVPRDKPQHIAAAYAALFKAANGGALGLFTAVQRLKIVHSYLNKELDQSDIELYSQHVDGLDTGTLTEIFKAEEDSCMLGTDATRDGMDVPGKSLRLIVFDRVPWPRPDILHKARRDYFGRGYDDRITRFRLKQAYGRLIRNESDKGVFVMLDSRLPSRLCNAFPEDVMIERIGLNEAVNIVKGFFL